MDLAGNVIADWKLMTAVDLLIDAVERQDKAAIRTQCSSPPVRSALESDSWTRLEIIASMAVSGCPELVAEAEDILRREPELSRARIGGGQTLIHRAAGWWNVHFCELLLDLGADPNARDVAGHPPLYYSGNRFPRPDGYTLEMLRELIDLFVRFGVDLNAAEGVKRSTPLHMAARRGHPLLAEALVQAGADIEARDSNGETPLRRAVNCSQPAVACVLLRYGADPRSRCARGRTPRDAARTDLMRGLFSA